MKRTCTILLIWIFFTPFCAHYKHRPKAVSLAQNDTAYQQAKRRINQRLLSLEYRVYFHPEKVQTIKAQTASAPVYGPPE